MAETTNPAIQKQFEARSAQNPEVAYRTGNIDAEQYRQLTGRYPEGYTPPGGSYDFWGVDNGYVPTTGGNKGKFGSPGGGGITRGALASTTSVAPRSSGNINTTW